MIVRKLSVMMLTSMVMAVTMVVAVTLWTAGQNNRTAAEDSQKMVAGGLEGRMDRLASLNSDYASWAAAFNAARARDVQWLTENMGAGANGKEFHVLQIVLPDDWSSLTWTETAIEAGTAPLNKAVVPVEVVRSFLPKLNMYERDVKDTQTAYLELDGETHAIAVSRIQPWGQATDVPVEEFPLMVFALRVNDAFLSRIADKFLIDDIYVKQDDEGSGARLPLMGPDGTVVSHLHWIPPRPGDLLIKTVSVPIAIGLAVFLILTGKVAWLARKNAKLLVASEAEALRVARKDAITCLPNRLALNERFAELRKCGGTISTLIVDLNGFKGINDSFGHDVGDGFIKLFAEYIGLSLPEDTFAARLGGDEFVVVFRGQTSEDQCIKFCNALKRRTKHPLNVDGFMFEITYALGYSSGDVKDLRSTELLRQADVAMYHAKKHKVQMAVRYDPTLEHDKREEERTIIALREALETCEEFNVVYQPIIDAKTGQLGLAEALVRWKSPTMGNVSPAYFIPIAERTSLIFDLGRFVIDRVFSDMTRLGALKTSINLSPAQLRNSKVIGEIRERAAFYGIDPSRVTFEITETTFMEDEYLVSFIMDGLREAGFQIALDDFGTGYSSIGYLRKMHFD
ncbi:MAG: EAL domain-containing protein, partial [Pseudomonadota bacterium]